MTAPSPLYTKLSRSLLLAQAETRADWLEARHDIFTAGLLRQLAKGAKEAWQEPEPGNDRHPLTGLGA